MAPAPLRQLDPTARRHVQAAVELLAVVPRPPGVKKLVGGEGECGADLDYWIVYEVHDRVLRVLVLAVGHRRQV